MESRVWLVLILVLFLASCNEATLSFPSSITSDNAPTVQYQLSITQQPSNTGTAGVALAQQPVVTIFNLDGTVATDQTAAVTLEAFTDSTCDTPVGTGVLGATTNPLNAVAGISTFAGVNYTKATTVYLKATSGTMTSACSDGITISAGAASKVHIRGPAIATQDSCASAYTAYTTDDYDNESNVSGNQVFNLASTGGGAFYSNNTCSVAAATVTILDATNTGSFYFKNANEETVTQTASLAGFTSGTLDVTTRDPDAIYVFGQPDFITSENLSRGFVSVGPVFSDGTRLYALESFTTNGQNARAKVFNLSPAASFAAPDFTLGAPDNSRFYSGQPSNYRFGGLKGVHSDGTYLAIADDGYNRVLIWNSVPNTHNIPADIPLGQVGSANNTAGVGVDSLDGPAGVFISGTKLIVADKNNNRVLIWNTIPVTSKQDADVVLGQIDFDSNDPNQGLAAPTAQTLSAPEGVWVVGGKLIVADEGNNRVLIWNSIPTINTTAADVVVGQMDMDDFAGATTQTGLSGPTAVYADTALYIADTGNNRVLVYNAIPAAHGAAADLVLGQANYTSSSNNIAGSITDQTMDQPNSITKDSAGNLFVTDLGNNRILMWTNALTVNRQAADIVIGSDRFDNNDRQNSWTPDGTNLLTRSQSNDSSVCTDGTRLFVSDVNRHRVLVWNTLPTGDNQPPDFVLGQPDQTSEAPGNGGLTIGLDDPTGVDCDANHVAVVDTGNNRVLIWSSPITSNHQAPNVVVGQSTFLTSGPGLTSTTLDNPTGVSIRNGRLLVSDHDNNRILIWNTIPTTNGATANLVLGQPNFTTNTNNQAGAGSLQSLYAPSHVFYDGTKVFVADSRNQRVLIWNTFPTTTQQAASLSVNACAAHKVFSNGTSLFTSHRAYNGSVRSFRICVWNEIPTATNQAVDRVIGQADTSTKNPAIGPDNFSGNVSISGSGSNFFVLDSDYHRLLIYDHVP